MDRRAFLFAIPVLASLRPAITHPLVAGNSIALPGGLAPLANLVDDYGSVVCWSNGGYVVSNRDLGSLEGLELIEKGPILRGRGCQPWGR